MARNKFDVDEELDQEFSWKDFKRLSQYVVPYKKSIGKVLFTIILANLARRSPSTHRFLRKMSINCCF